MPKSISFSSSDPKPYVSFAVSLLSKTDFEAKTPVPGQIVFLEEENLIYFDGEYYGITSQQAATLTDVAARITVLEGEVGHQGSALAQLTGAYTNLANAVLALKNNQGEWGTQGVAGMTVTQAINDLQSQINGMTTGVASVNKKTGTVVLDGTDLLVGGSGSSAADSVATAIENRVVISSTDTTAKPNSGIQGASLTNTAAIATAIEAAHTAAVNANANADDKIAKSDSSTAPVATGYQSSITGIAPNSLEDGEDIAEAIEGAAATLIGTSDKWKNGEDKTIGQVRTLIDTLNGQVTELIGTDSTTLAKITNIIKELNQSEDGESLAATYIDKIMPLLAYASTFDSNGAANGAQGYYAIGTGEGAVYRNTLQGIIDELYSKISAAAAGGVLSLTGIQGVHVDQSAGNVTVSGDSGILTTAALTQTDSHGATTAAGSTVQSALQDINTAAAGAHSAADAAQTSANNALGQLTWQIIS